MSYYDDLLAAHEEAQAADWQEWAEWNVQPPLENEPAWVVQDRQVSQGVSPCPRGFLWEVWRDGMATD